MRNKRGFTLVELIVTVALLAVVAGVSLSVVYNINGSVNFTQQVAYRQYDTAFAERMLNNYIETADSFTIKDKNSPLINDQNTNKEQIRIRMRQSDGKNIVSIEKITTSGLVYSILDLRGVTKATFRIAQKTDGNYVMSYELVSEELTLKGGTTALNVKEFNGTDPTEIVYNTADNIYSDSNQMRILITTPQDPRKASSS